MLRFTSLAFQNYFQRTSISSAFRLKIFFILFLVQTQKVAFQKGAAKLIAFFYLPNLFRTFF
jgi:hypothetical protein